MLLLDGKTLAEQIRGEIRTAVESRVAAGKNPPGLAVVLVGENPASMAYVKSKSKACAEAGFHSEQHDLPATTTEAELLKLIAKLNADRAIHGILVQLPLPKQINEQRIIGAITPRKDVDGFHPENVGRLALGMPRFVPCTPLGVQELLVRNGIETAGKFAVVLGRSNIVGKPMAMLLSAKGPGGDATVAICHTRTTDLGGICRRADILIAAAGVPQCVTRGMVKRGATVIDVGINRVADVETAKGYRLVGDVDFDAVSSVAGAITPVPGGVGPMTIAMLLKNTLMAAEGN